jgi:hypothetical protein
MIRVLLIHLRSNKGPNPKIVPEYLSPISHKSPKDYKKNRNLREFALLGSGKKLSRKRSKKLGEKVLSESMKGMKDIFGA